MYIIYKQLNYLVHGVLLRLLNSYVIGISVYPLSHVLATWLDALVYGWPIVVEEALLAHISACLYVDVSGVHGVFSCSAQFALIILYYTPTGIYIPKTENLRDTLFIGVAYICVKLHTDVPIIIYMFECMDRICPFVPVL